MALYFELDLGSLSLGRTSKPWFLKEFGILSMNLFYGICITICFLSEANIAMQSLQLQKRKLAYRERNGDLLLFKMFTFLLSRYNEFEVLWRFMPKEKCQNCLCWALLHHKFLKEGAVSSLQKCPHQCLPDTLALSVPQIGHVYFRSGSLLWLGRLSSKVWFLSFRYQLRFHVLWAFPDFPI